MADPPATSVPDDVWISFASAGFTCWCPAPITVRPAAAGTTSGPFPFPGPVAFVTADNPRGRTVAQAENLARRVALADALDQLGAGWVPAAGGDPGGHHVEVGAVISGLDAASATELGLRFDQAAVYLWEPAALHLVACAGDRHDVLGYTASPGPASLRSPRLRP